MLNEEKLEKNVEILNMDLISQTINNSNNNNNIGTWMNELSQDIISLSTVNFIAPNTEDSLNDNS